jgi:hypothetical protein
MSTHAHDEAARPFDVIVATSMRVRGHDAAVWVLLAALAGSCAHDPPPLAPPPSPPPPSCGEQRISATLLRVQCAYYAHEQLGWAWNESLRRGAVSALAAGFPLLQTLSTSQDQLTTTTTTPVECTVRRSVWRSSRATCTGGPKTIPVGAMMSTDFEFLTNDQGAARSSAYVPEDRRPWSGAAFLNAQAARAGSRSER